MSAPRKVSDEAILGCIREHEIPVRAGPTQREIADYLGVAHATVRDRLKTLLDAGEIERSPAHGYIVKESPCKTKSSAKKPRPSSSSKA